MTESYLDWILAKAETAVRDAKTAIPTISKVNLNFENFSLRFGHCLILFSFWNFQIFPVKEAAGFSARFQIRVSNDVYKFSFYPRTIVAWNNLPIYEDVNINNFKTIVLAAIKSFV